MPFFTSQNMTLFRRLKFSKMFLCNKYNFYMRCKIINRQQSSLVFDISLYTDKQLSHVRPSSVIKCLK